MLFKHGPKTAKMSNLCPKASQMDSKKKLKNMLKITRLTKKLENVKPNENISIYKVFSTSDHQISMRFKSRNMLKSNLKTDAEIHIPQISEN